MTTTLNQNSTDPIAQAIAASALLAQCCRENAANREQIEDALNALKGAIEALEPTIADEHLMCYLRNRRRSSRRLLLRGETGAARYQFQEMARKLNTAWARAARLAAGSRLRKRGGSLTSAS